MARELVDCVTRGDRTLVGVRPADRDARAIPLLNRGCTAPRALLPRDDHIADELAEVRLSAAQLGGAVR